MDLITGAVLAALQPGVATGAGKIGESLLEDTYGALKAALRRKFGGESDVVDAVEKLEAKPDSAGRKETLQEEVAAVKADQDPEVLGAAQALLDQIKAKPSGEQHIQNAFGSYIAQADRGGTATVQVNQPPE